MSDEQSINEYTPLDKPVRLDMQNWPDGTRPLVSICCITYNHEKFIEECLNGFLMQETTFPVEILIHDDASTDGTSKIIKKYEKKLPKIFKPFYQTENQYSKGVRLHVTFNHSRASGTYIAMCEGDDYWTETLKIQTQVDILEKNSAAVGCCHNVRVIYEDEVKDPHLMFLGQRDKNISLEDLLTGNKIATLSVIYKTNLISEFPKWYHKLPIGDWPLHVLNAEHGQFIYLEKDMATYRVNNGGVWSGSSDLKRKLMDIKVVNAYRNHFHNKYSLELKKYLAKLHYEAAEIMISDGETTSIYNHILYAIVNNYKETPKRRLAILLFKNQFPLTYSWAKNLRIILIKIVC